MIYISLLVHERAEVIADQLANFRKYFPSAITILHVSKNSEGLRSKIEEQLKQKNLDNYIINPDSTSTSWGGIIGAHLLNISFIQSLRDARFIVFHSSNDMLIRVGAESYIRRFKNIQNRRPVRLGGHWWVSRVAAIDPDLRRTLASLGTTLIFGSQIEGSSYDADVLFEINTLINKYETIQPDLKYPREEILFPSLAAALKIHTEALPYIYSEVHYFDQKLWSIFDKFNFLLNDRTALNSKAKRIVNDVMFHSGFYKIRTDDIENIISGACEHLRCKSVMDDGLGNWDVYELENIFGVKRIMRRLEDPVRQYIRGL